LEILQFTIPVLGAISVPVSEALRDGWRMLAGASRTLHGRLGIKVLGIH
jgi:hypothetical protein